MTSRDYLLVKTIRSLLSSLPDNRPSADELLSDLSLCDQLTGNGNVSVFGPCCHNWFVPKTVCNEALASLEKELQKTQMDLNAAHNELESIRRAPALVDVKDSRTSGSSGYRIHDGHLQGSKFF